MTQPSYPTEHFTMGGVRVTLENTHPQSVAWLSVEPGQLEGIEPSLFHSAVSHELHKQFSFEGKSVGEKWEFDTGQMTMYFKNGRSLLPPRLKYEHVRELLKKLEREIGGKEALIAYIRGHGGPGGTPISAWNPAEKERDDPANRWKREVETEKPAAFKEFTPEKAAAAALPQLQEFHTVTLDTLQDAMRRRSQECRQERKPFNADAAFGAVVDHISDKGKIFDRAAKTRLMRSLKNAEQGTSLRP